MTYVNAIERSRRKVFGMKKKKLIEVIIQEVPALDTTAIVRAVKARFNVNVSERSVQRVRKFMDEKGNEEMNVNTKKDEWDTGKPEDKVVQEEQKTQSKLSNLNDLSDDEITIINMANEGGWSIEQMSEGTHYTANYIRKTLNTHSHLVTGEVLDEEDPNVYISKGTQDILDELDALPGGQGGHGVAKSKTNFSGGSGARRAGEDFWEVEQDVVKACSKCDKAVNVFMNIASRRKAMLYMKWAGAREWLAYLVGEKVNDDYVVTDLYLPDQRTCSTLVDNVDTSEFNNFNIVGVIHSHHEMGAGDADRPSFSGHDDNFINSNHNLSLLAGKDRQSNGFKIVGIARVTTPCGAFMKVKANIKSMVEDPEGDKALKDEFLEKTQTQPQSYVKNYGNGYGYGYNPLYPVAHKGGYQTQTVHPVVTGAKKTHTPDESGVVQTRGPGFHFTN